MTEPRYIFNGVADAAELERLRLHEQWLDPLSEKYLTEIGVASGARCLDVGAGAGSVARWLSTRVGAEGRVVAADIDTRFLIDLPPQVEVRRMNVLTDDLETGFFDVIHCRTLLGHLTDPSAALARLTDALAPEGHLVAFDDDLGLVTIAGHPDAPAATELFHQWIGQLKTLGIVDACIGRSIPGLLAAAGLTDVKAEGITMVGQAGDAVYEDHRRAWTNVRELVIANGIPGEDWDRAVAVFDHDAAIYVGTTMFVTRGRKRG